MPASDATQPDHGSVAGGRCRQTLFDAVKRGFGGTHLFLAMWLVIGWTSGVEASSPWVYWLNAAAFATYGLVRHGLMASMRDLTIADAPRAEKVFVAALLFNALHWGVLTASTAVWPPMQQTWLPMWLTSVGFAGVGAINMSMLKALRIGLPLCVLVPVVSVLGWLDARHHVFEIIAATLYLVYVWHVSKSAQDDYHGAASAIEDMEQRARQLELLSITDSLTGIHNRHLFDHRLITEWSRAARDGEALSMLMIDIDHFKRVNDNFGHPVGDRCLIAVAKALSGALGRSTDVLARYGGEEFAVLLLRADIDAAERIGERLRRSVEAIDFVHEGVRIPLACSVGVSTARPVPGSSAVHAMQQADMALYTAKRDGRNRVAVAETAAC